MTAGATTFAAHRGSNAVARQIIVGEVRCWQPDVVQELALVAATGEANNALHAWADWLAETDFDEVDPGSGFLLPLVRHNLGLHRATDEMVGLAYVGRLRGLARRSWYESRLVLHRGAPAIDALQAADLDVCVLGGAALAARWFPEISLRPVSSIELLVRETDAERAVALLRRHGWHDRDPTILAGGHGMPTAPVRRVRSGVAMTDGIATVTLRWHAFDDCCWDDADEQLWARTEPFDLGGRQVIGLDPSHEFLRTAVHGVRRGVGAVPWVTDAIQIARAGLDWSDVTARSRALRLTPPFASAVSYLASSPHGIVPPGVVARVEAKWLDRQCLTPASGPTGRLLHPRRMISLYGRYRRSAAGSARRRRPSGLVDFAQCSLGVGRRSQIPVTLVGRALRTDVAATERSSTVPNRARRP